MKTITNSQHSTIKRILSTFGELKFDKNPPVRVLNQQRIAKQILKKL